MREPTGVLLVRDDGVIDVPTGVVVVGSLVEAVERLFGTLGIPARPGPEATTTADFHGDQQ